MTFTCVSIVKQCVRDVASDDLPSLVCKFSFSFCGVPVSIVSAVGTFGSPNSAKKLKTCSKFLLNVIGAPISVSTFCVDYSLESLEVILFGEACSIMKGGSFFIN